MEVRVYLNFEAYGIDKAIYCAKVAAPEVFEFQKCREVLRSIYGLSAIIIFMCYN